MPGIWASALEINEFRGHYPIMDCFNPITIEDQTLFTNIFANIKPNTSELTFPYLYMWKKDYNLKFAVVADHLCMISQSRIYDPFAFCPIPVDGKRDDSKFLKALKAIEDYFNHHHLPLMFGRVEESRLDELRMAYGSSMKEEYLDSASDYVYNASDLINLAGKKFSGKRNHISQFMRNYGEYAYIPVDESNLSECKRILDEWCDKNENCVHPDNCERYAGYELLDNWSRLKMKGALLKVDGRFEAFTAGELLNPETAVVRLEKGNSEIHGIYTVINRDFCAHEWSGVKYINREEDLGLEGLRKSKHSYNPVFMIRKFLVKVIH